MRYAGKRCAIFSVVIFTLLNLSAFSGSVFAEPASVSFSSHNQEPGYSQRLQNLIDRAEQRIDIALYGLDDWHLYLALKRASARSVEIRILLDSAQQDRKQNGDTVSHLLEQAGVDVRYINKTNHHKFILVDQREACSSSGNWTVSADQEFDEQAIWFDDQELLSRYRAEFALLWHNSREFGQAFEFSTVVEEVEAAQSSIVDLPGRQAYFTSSNFRTYESARYGPTFAKVAGQQTVADALVDLIENAQQSIYIAVTHLRSRPIAEALLAKKATHPEVEIRVVLDAQEFITPEYDAYLIEQRNQCVAEAATDNQRAACLDSGHYYSYALHAAGIGVRFKTNSYLWDYETSRQMHSKYAIFDGNVVAAGSYNYSNNAETNSVENLLVVESAFTPQVVSEFADNFQAIWSYGRVEKYYQDLMQYLASGAQLIPLQYPVMTLNYGELSALKDRVSKRAPAVTDDYFRKHSDWFSVIDAGMSWLMQEEQLVGVKGRDWQLDFTYSNDSQKQLASATLQTADDLKTEESWAYDANGLVSQYRGNQFSLYTRYNDVGDLVALDAGQGEHSWVATELNSGTNVQYHSPTQANSLDVTLDEWGSPLTLTDADQRTLQWRYDDKGFAVGLSLPSLDISVSEPDQNSLLQETSDGESILLGYQNPEHITLSTKGSVAADIEYQIADGEDGTRDLSIAVKNNMVDGGYGSSSDLVYRLDAYNRVVQAGNNIISRAVFSGEILSIQNGNIEELREYDEKGRLELKVVRYQGADLYRTQYRYDGLGRIQTVDEFVAGDARSLRYYYQLNGMLSAVYVDSVLQQQFGYDAWGNRLELTGSEQRAGYQYDGANRLQQREWKSSGKARQARYDYNLSGQLQQVRYLTVQDGSSWQTRSRSYQYNTLGYLQQVSWASQQREYRYDPMGRRIATFHNGELSSALLYGLDELPLAELNENGRIINTYFYADGLTPIGLRKGNRDYYVVSDIRGSVRLIVNVGDGTIVQRLDYDSYGQILQDTNPGYTVFAYASGLYDPATGLTRFGVRDYDAEIGRWTAEDPIGFVSGEINFYTYVANDPVNFVDPTGLSKVETSTTLRMNAQVTMERGTATVNFTQRRATSLSSSDIRTLKTELKEKGVKNVVVNSGQVVEPTGRLRRILQRKADTGGVWNGLNVWSTGNPKNEFVLTGSL